MQNKVTLEIYKLYPVIIFQAALTNCSGSQESNVIISTGAINCSLEEYSFEKRKKLIDLLPTTS